LVVLCCILRNRRSDHSRTPPAVASVPDAKVLGSTYSLYREHAPNKVLHRYSRFLDTYSFLDRVVNRGTLSSRLETYSRLFYSFCCGF
jgi:hypothetical protein